MSVELLDHMGDDLAIVNAARVSYAKQSTWGTKNDGQNMALRDADAGLIQYLMKNRHGTPFEMVVFKFRIRCPIGVAREWQRHRIGSFNEVSTRYVEMQPDFYVPEHESVRTQVGKPGHYEMLPMSLADADAARLMMNDTYHFAYERYQMLISQGVAKELARNVLPLGLLTEFIWCVNLRSLLNFLSLRTHPTALLEIRIEAQEVERLARQVVPTAMTAWDEHGRVSP